MKRRDFMIGTGAAGLVLASKPRTRTAVPTMLVPSAVKPLVISSANGNQFKNGGEVTCVQKAFTMITQGEDVLDSVIAGVNIVELDPLDDSVGYGGLPNAEGVVQLDSSCMHGPKRQAGVNCVVVNNCTFAGSDSERSAYSKGLYVFAGSTVNKQFRFFVFASRSTGTLDFDFGAGPRYPRVSPPAIAARQASAAGLCPDRDGNFAPVRNAPLDPGPGASFHINGNIRYQPSTPLNFTLSFTKERLRRNDTHLLAFDENIVSLKSTYQFTRFIFARGRIDYDTLASNVKGQFLFGYTPNPGTAFYVGYNDDMNRNGFSPFSRQLEPGFRRNGRTFFIKMSYLFRRSFAKS